MAAERIQKPAVIEAGQQYHGWTVLSFSHSDKYAEKFYKCRCTCGTEKLVRRSRLGWSKSCGCSRHTERKLAADAGKAKGNDIVINQRYRNWTVLSESDKTDSKGEKHYMCRCVCGKERAVRKSALGRNIGCGCSRNKGIAAATTSKPPKMKKSKQPITEIPPAKTKKLMANPVDLVGSGFSNEHKDYKPTREKRKPNTRRLLLEKRLDEMALERELRSIDLY